MESLSLQPTGISRNDRGESCEYGEHDECTSSGSDREHELYQMSRLRQREVFGDSHIEEISEKFNIPVLGKLPIDPKLTQACDAGLIEDVENIYLDGVMDIIL